MIDLPLNLETLLATFIPGVVILWFLKKQIGVEYDKLLEDNKIISKEFTEILISIGLGVIVFLTFASQLNILSYTPFARIQIISTFIYWGLFAGTIYIILNKIIRHKKIILDKQVVKYTLALYILTILISYVINPSQTLVLAAFLALFDIIIIISILWLIDIIKKEQLCECINKALLLTTCIFISTILLSSVLPTITELTISPPAAVYLESFTAIENTTHITLTVNNFEDISLVILGVSNNCSNKTLSGNIVEPNSASKIALGIYPNCATTFTVKLKHKQETHYTCTAIPNSISSCTLNLKD